jgi:Zn-dependent M28 family amino/carboxypeptidase
MLKRFLKYLRNVFCGVALVIFAIWVYLAQPTLRASDPVELASDIDRLRTIVKTLSVDFHPRTFRHAENLEKTAAFIESHLKAAGGRVESQNFAVSGDTFRNVRSFFGPESGPTIIVGAHYDSHGVTPGADDNASGVAGLIELAYLLQANPTTQRIELVAYPLEEPPFFATKKMGSYFHAEAVSQESNEIVSVIVLEMIGYFNETRGSQDYPVPLFKLMYPNTGNFIAVIGKLDQRPFISEIKAKMKGAAEIDVYSIAAPTNIPGIDFSDHRNYWEFGYNAVMITDTAFYRNKAYHEVGDTWDRLNYEKMGEVVKAVYNAVK